MVMQQASLPAGSAAASQPQHSTLTESLYSAITQSQPRPESPLQPSPAAAADGVLGIGHVVAPAEVIRRAHSYCPCQTVGMANQSIHQSFTRLTMQ